MEMERAVELATWTSSVAFLVLTLIALRVYRRHSDSASKWLVVSFGVLAGGLLIARTGVIDVVPVLAPLPALAVLAFPYLLLQFTAAFRPLHPVFRVGPAVAFVGLAVWTVIITPLSQEDRSPAEAAWVLTFLAFFVLMSLAVAVRMWRGGKGEPTIARRRMRTLAVAVVLLSVALIVAGASAGRPGFALLVQLTGIAATILFGIAFLPPRLLRASWRALEEDELYRAALRLMATTSDGEVAGILLPHVTRVVGGHGATLESIQGDVLGTYGEAADGDQPLDVTLTRTRLRVWVSPYTPFFGDEEAKLLLRLGLLADLALDRASLLEREQEARAEVEAVNAELEAFVYSASHDLRTPLVTILGFLDVLGDPRADVSDEDADFYLGRMRANARYMQALIADLLELSRIGRVETTIEQVELADLMAEIAEGLAATHPEVRLEVAGDLPVLAVNRARMRQLFANLVENAARYGGRTDITVTVSADVRDDGCELRVVDDGVGIPEEHRERVFGVFERLADDEGGTGIGLAICRKIVAELGGEIRFVDGDGGADARIVLPPETVVEAADARAPSY